MMVLRMKKLGLDVKARLYPYLSHTFMAQHHLRESRAAIQDSLEVMRELGTSRV